MTDCNVEWREDGSAVAVARLAAWNGSGSATGVSGEGRWLEQADIEAITCAVYDLNSATPSTPTSEPTVTVATAVQDTPVTNGEIWPKDDIGWNFRHVLAATCFPTANHRYRVIYTLTLTGGEETWGSFEGVAKQKVPA